MSGKKKSNLKLPPRARVRVRSQSYCNVWAMGKLLQIVRCHCCPPRLLKHHEYQSCLTQLTPQQCIQLEKESRYPGKEC